MSSTLHYTRPTEVIHTAIILEATTYYIYSIIKMANKIVSDFLWEESYEPTESDVKQQKLTEYILTGNSKQYLCKAYIKEKIKKLSVEEVGKLFSNYEAKLSSQVKW